VCAGACAGSDTYTSDIFVRTVVANTAANTQVKAANTCLGTITENGPGGPNATLKV